MLMRQRNMVVIFFDFTNSSKRLNMSWWTTEDNLILGDEPADLVTALLLHIVELKGGVSLTLQDLLDGILLALENKPDVFSEGDENAISRIAAKVEPGEQEFVGNDSNLADSQLIDLLSEAFEEIAVSYEDSELERKPSLNELLANVAFVLGYQPDEYLLLPQGVSITNIYAELD